MKAAEVITEMWANMREEAHLALSWQQLESIVRRCPLACPGMFVCPKDCIGSMEAPMLRQQFI